MSIIDSDKGKLNSTIWLDNNLLHSAKSQIVKPLYDKLKKLKVPLSEVEGVYFTGSNATTRYREDSDIDVNVRLHVNQDTNFLDILAELTGINGKLLKGTKHEINYYVSDQNYQLNMPNIYDVVNDEWLAQDDVKDIDIELYKNYAKPKLNDINNLVFELESDIIDYKDLIYLTDDNKIISKKVSNKIEEIQNDMTKIKEEYLELRLKRNTDFTDESYNNIVYKFLEKYKLLQKLIKVKKLLKDGFQTSDIDKYIEKILKVRKGLKYYQAIIESLKERLL